MVSNGTLLVNSSIPSSPTVTVSSSAAFGGTGVVSGVVTINGGGILAAGDTNGLGTLTVTNISFSAGATNLVRIAGLNNGQYSCLNIADGNISITNLSLLVDDTGMLNSGRVIIMKTTSGTINGEFNGLPQGEWVSGSRNKWKVSYNSTNVTLTFPAYGAVIEYNLLS